MTPRSSKFLSLFAAFALLLLTPPAKAAIDDAGAAKLKTMLNKAFMQQINIQNNMADAGVKLDGEIVVEPAGSYYAVTFPHISAGNETLGTKVDIGMIAANVSPGEKDGTWKMAIAMPSPITFYEKNEPAFTLDLGKQHFVGLWDESLEYFTKIDLDYKNVNANIAAADMVLNIPSVKMFSNFTENDPGFFSGPANFNLAGLNLKGTDGKDFFSLGDMQLAMTMDNFSAESWTQFMDQYEKMSEQLAADGNDEINEDAFKKSMSDMLMSYADTLKGGFTAQYTFKDMVIHYPENKKDAAKTLDEELPDTVTEKKDLEKIEIANAGFGFDLINTSETLKQINIRLSHNGVKLTPMPEQMSEHIPHTMNFDISFKNLPMQELFQTGQQIANSAQGNKDAAKMAGMQAMFTLPQVLAKAETAISFNNTYFENNTSRVALSGDINASASSAFGATANLVAQISNLDDLMKAAQEEAKGANKSFIAQAYPVLLMLKGIAETTPGPGGKVLSLFNIVVNEQGQATVNGNSMDMITGGGGGR